MGVLDTIDSNDASECHSVICVFHIARLGFLPPVEPSSCATTIVL